MIIISIMIIIISRFILYVKKGNGALMHLLVACYYRLSQYGYRRLVGRKECR